MQEDISVYTAPFTHFSQGQNESHEHVHSSHCETH